MEKKSVSIKLKHPNPLFEKWLTEWRDLERQRNSKKEHCYGNALKSLKKYPLPLKTGKECIVLQGFGEKLCRMLDDRLSAWRSKGDAAAGKYESVSGASDNEVVSVIPGNHLVPITGAPAEPAKRKKPNDPRVLSEDSTTKGSKKTKTGTTEPGEYSPAYRTGAYAILVALYKDSLQVECKDYMLKDEIIDVAQEYCASSFRKSATGGHYTAWSAMSGLITKGLVNRKGNPAKFSLTDPGLILGHKLYKNQQKLAAEGKENETELRINSDFDVCGSQNNQSNEAKRNGFENGSDPTNILPNLITVDGNILPQVITNESSKPFENSLPQKKVGTLPQINKPMPKKKLPQTVIVEDCDADLRSGGVKPKVKKKAFTKHPSGSSIESTSCTEEETFIFPPDTFDVYLLVDTQETAGIAKKSYDLIILELNRLEVQYEVRHLKVGDYTWICRERGGSKELVLPYVVERKRIDDFGSSIKDGRFHEQKFRLKQSGVQNLVYLVENCDVKYAGLPLSSLLQAATNTLVQDGFLVKFTENLRGTVEYLATFSKIIEKLYKAKTLVSCPKKNLSQFSVSEDLISLMTFKDFNLSSSKNKGLKVQDFFVKQLLQLKGVSVDKALAITETYPTPRLLLQKYNSLNTTEGENLLSNLPFGTLQKKIGPAISPKRQSRRAA